MRNRFGVSDCVCLIYSREDILPGAGWFKNERNRLAALRIDPGYMNAKKTLEALYRSDKKDDKNKDQEKNQNDKKNDGDKKQGGKKQGGKDNRSAGQKNMNKDQIKGLLQMMKDKPVRRQKNDEDKGILGGGHEKPW